MTHPIMKLIADITPIKADTLPHIAAAQDLTSIVCYKFDVKTGKATSKTINADIGKTAKEYFAAEIIRIWYGLEKIKLQDDARRIIERIDKALKARDKEQDAKSGTETPVLTAEERAACIAAKARIDANETALVYHIDNVAKPQVYASNLTARLFVHVYRRDRLTDADVSIFADLYKDARKIIDARKNADYNSAVEDPTTASKVLRQRAETTLRAVWQPQEGLVESYDIHVGKRLGDELYSILHKGLTTDKSGDIVSRDASAADLTREVLLALFRDLQIKNTNRKAPAADAVATPAADKPKTADKPDKPKRERNHARKTTTDAKTADTATNSNPAPAKTADTTPDDKTAA